MKHDKGKGPLNRVVWFTMALLGAVLFAVVVYNYNTGFSRGDRPGCKAAVGEKTMVTIKTNMGDIKVELFDQKAPLTVKNFMDYVDEGFFSGTIFHRVIDGFMIQGGGHVADMSQKPTRAPVKNEASAELKNLRGTIAMARTGVIDSGTSQFFINVVDNAFLDHKDNSDRGFGYCAFGKVVDGMDVVDKIGKVKTGRGDVPQATVEIIAIERAK